MTSKQSPQQRRTIAAQRALEVSEPIDVEAYEEAEDDTEPNLPALRPVTDLPIGAALPATREATVAEMVDRRNRVQEFMQSVMRPGIDGDYAVIPGTGDKPVLLKPGAEKLARLFNLAIVRMERTMLAPMGDEGMVAGYHFALAGPDGRTWGEAEAFAGAKEKTFERLASRTGGGAAMLNALTARAQKRAFVRAVLQATGASDLFSSENLEAQTTISDRQQKIVVAIVTHAKPGLAATTIQQAAKTKAEHWELYLQSALDSIPGITEDRKGQLFAALVGADATEDTVRELLEAA